ncbi:hypothetical protein M3Y99_01940200 [Aphelenchoides fujianensis]|nr:hypothetical protein M3Y99_01940200 [Aphelenchoides fujianensis]
MTMPAESSAVAPTLRPLSTVVTSLRPLNADLLEAIGELNDLWRQLRAIGRTDFEEKERIAAFVRINLTEKIEGFRESLAALRSHIAVLQAQLNVPLVHSISRTFVDDLRTVRDHLIRVDHEYTRQLERMSTCKKLEEFAEQEAIKETSLFDASYRLVAALRRLRADLTLK